MKFVKYPSIENSYNEKTLKFFREHIPDLDKTPCIVEEKLHGANFSFYYDYATKELKCAKRSGFIAENENFYNYQRMVERYKERILIAFEELRFRYESKFNTKLFWAVISGELIGGSFPGEVSKTKAIQKGVYYSPDIEFVAFDIAFQKSNNLGENFVICDQAMKHVIFLNADLPFPKVLMQGTLAECLKFNPEFRSEMYKTFGYEGDFENSAEGGVIKPINAIVVEGYSFLLKIKGEKWREKHYESKPRIELNNEIVSHYFDLLTLYLTENRLNAVLSKDSLELDFKNFKEIARPMMIDIIEDFEKENEVNSEHESEYKQAKAFLWKDIEKFIRNQILGLTRA